MMGRAFQDDSALARVKHRSSSGICHAGTEELGLASQDDLDLSHVLEYVWFPLKSQLTILLDQLSVQFSMEKGRTLRACWYWARAEAAEVLESIQESAAILLEQLFMRFSKVRDLAVQDGFDLLHVLEHLKYL